eukprot:SAG11_NODE_306_length_10992_cov_46.270816_3_plen_110_part_00
MDHQKCLVDLGEYVTADDRIVHAEVHRLEVPRLVAVESRHVHPARDVDRLAELIDLREGALNPVDNLASEARPKLKRERLLGTVDWVPDRQTRRLLVHLDRGFVSLRMY